MVHDIVNKIFETIRDVRGSEQQIRILADETCPSKIDEKFNTSFIMHCQITLMAVERVKSLILNAH